MPQKRVNYGRMYQKNASYRRDDMPEKEVMGESTTPEPEIVESSPRYRYRKTVLSRIRIRKGPGLNFDHNGEYVTDDEIEVTQVVNNFGLLSKYDESGDGWVSLEYFESSE